LIELYDLETKEKLFGADAECRITIIDDDQPGNLCFRDRNVKVTSKDKFATIIVSRTNGCDGIVKCKYETENATSAVGNTATPYEDYLPKSGVLTFNHQETEKEIKIEILEKENDDDDRNDMFTVRIFEPEPDGCKITKKDRCFVDIVGDNGKLIPR
jgi:hypothetical protein